jgi:hypothetical protein
MRASKVSAAYRVARKSAAMSTMSAKVMSAAVVTLKTVTSAVAAAATSAMAAAFGDGIARQHQHENNSRNSQRAPSHGTLPAVTPLTSRRKR